MDITIELPWPPSSNTYWRRNGSRYFISKNGKDYRALVNDKCKIYSGFFGNEARISLSIEAFPPDKRKRDLDNLFKSLLDSLQFAKVFGDDNQIDKLAIERMDTNINKIVLHMELI